MLQTYRVIESFNRLMERDSDANRIMYFSTRYFAKRYYRKRCIESKCVFLQEEMNTDEWVTIASHFN